MKKPVRLRWILLGVILLVAFTLGWFNATRKAEQSFQYAGLNLNPDKEITHITTGVIKSDTLLAVRFKEEQVGGNDLNQTIDSNDIFVIEPALKGKVYWTDRRTVVFAPAKPLLSRNRYIGIFNIKALFPGIENLKPERRVFEFETLGQQILNLSGDFQPVDGEDSGLFFRGRLELAEECDPKRLSQALKFLEGGKEHNLTVEKGEQLVYTLKSGVLFRSEQERIFQLTVQHQKLDLSEDFTRTFTLAPRGELQVLRIEEEREGDATRLRIIFSEELDSGINYRGFVNLEPPVDFATEIAGKSMLIKGDFVPGQRYIVKLFSGIRSRLGQELTSSEDFVVELKISDLSPRLEFVNSGIFLSTAKNKQVAFRTLNLARVHLKVKQVQEENLIQFLEENSLRVGSKSFDDYNRYGFKRLGEVLESRILEIGSDQNKWVQSAIDLSGVIQEENSGLYILQLEFAADDALYFPEDWEEWRIRNYLWRNGRQVKHIILSDLGLTAKKLAGETHVFVTDILQAKPLPDATVLLKDASNQLIETAYTDQNGSCVLKKEGDYIEVRKRYQYSILKFKESRLDYSLFEVGGIKRSGATQAFIYPDRGVYRPGDQINLAVIARNRDDTFPADHPVTLRFYNPRDRLVVEQTRKQAEDGFYSFNFSTDLKALTGNWRAEFKIGDSSFQQLIRIEEIVPYRLKVEIASEKEKLNRTDRSVDFSINSSYLFGAPAAGLESRARLKVEPFEIGFSGFPNYTFTNDSIEFKAIESGQLIGQLDQTGRTEISWQLPEIGRVPSAVKVALKAEVLEKGGRSVPAVSSLPIEVYQRYVGISKTEQEDLQIGSQASFNLVLVSADGRLIPGQELKYRIYHLRKYWWWEFDNRRSFRQHYKTDQHTELVKEGTLLSADHPLELTYNLSDYGEMLIEVEDQAGGHSAAYFFRSYWWGEGEASVSADLVNIKTDQEKYFPGETARVVVKTPEQGLVLLTVEKGDQLLYREWKESEGSNTEFAIPVRPDYVPNVYLAVSVFQPYAETGNDRPVRLYGVVPLLVEREDSHLDFTVETPATLEPGQEFTVKINSAQPAQFTVAVVDEGLLDLTDFPTPDPRRYFYQKEMLKTATYDTFSDIIGLDWGYIYHIFSTGGGSGGADRYLDRQLQTIEQRRFKPVTLFAGPVSTDQLGQARVSFTMPADYIGRVRVMVIGAAQGRYGNRAEQITVKSPLMVLPTFPRVLRPEDRIVVPVTLFALEENLGTVQVKMELNGPLRLIGAAEKTLSLSTVETREISFELATQGEVGPAEIKITASTPEHRAGKAVELTVRAERPYTYRAEERVVEGQSEVKLQVPAAGIKNTSSVQLSIARRQKLNLNHRRQWLLRYPYGCVEQITSTVFPQLYLKGFAELSRAELISLDRNINQAIEKLRTFQLADGSFSYWPNGTQPNLWGTNYAGHFLLEASNKGYYVPAELLENWVKFQLAQSKENQEDYLTRAYRLYLLALANRQPLNALNYLRESKLEQIGVTAQYYLAAAYQLLGYTNTAAELIQPLTTEVKDYRETGGTYGSGLRDRAIMLEVATLLKDEQRGALLYDVIVEDLSSGEWYSTQTTAYSLLALSKYIMTEQAEHEILSGRVLLPEGEEVDFALAKELLTLPLEQSFDQEIRLINDAEQPLYATLEWEGIPQRDQLTTQARNLTLSVRWLDEDGREIDPVELEQGTTFWGVFRVGKEVSGGISEIALVQLLPTGWEIENLRLHSAQLPDWMEDLHLNQEEFLDIRDDRIMWFFDLADNQDFCDFAVKINAVTVGEFYLPPTVVEAMYNNDYQAGSPGKKVRVKAR